MFWEIKLISSTSNYFLFPKISWSVIELGLYWVWGEGVDGFALQTSKQKSRDTTETDPGSAPPTRLRV